MLSMAVAKLAVDAGVRVNAVCPTSVDTDLSARSGGGDVIREKFGISAEEMHGPSFRDLGAGLKMLCHVLRVDIPEKLSTIGDFCKRPGLFRQIELSRWPGRSVQSHHQFYGKRFL